MIRTKTLWTSWTVAGTKVARNAISSLSTQVAKGNGLLYILVT